MRIFKEDRDHDEFKVLQETFQSSKSSKVERLNPIRTPSNMPIKISSPKAALKSKARVNSKIDGSQAKRTKAEGI